ncbi:lactate racemase domain-containing protein [Caldalkalibacillus uzonensis]|nr:lactate racemase domain-containing protein [Caldalkalibacillus uzonensis]
MIEIEQIFSGKRLTDIKRKVHKEIRKNPEVQRLAKGAEIAVTAGSRGIANIAEILRETVSALKGMGYEPFLVPAMGSHGGGTAEGQVEVLKHLGVTEEAVGTEIRSSMDVELIAHTDDGVPVYMDKNAYHADGIVVVNRVKPHTSFRGRVESGLSKMVTIGLGKIKGARLVHSNGAVHMARNIEKVSKCAIENSKILMGLAIVENAYEDTVDVVGVTRDEWHDKEEELLKQAKAMMPSLPVDDIDLLIIEEMGKIYSGTGMDPNIIGRWRMNGLPEPEVPNIKRIVVLDLAHQSFGNAMGVGLADFTTRKLFDKIDLHATYTNALTSTNLQRAMIPLIYPTEKDSIETAIKSLGSEVNYASLKVVQIPNTLHLKHVLVSKPVLKEMESTGKGYKMIRTCILDFNEHNELTNRLMVHN